MNRAILLVSLALPIAACGSKPAVDERNASVAEVAQAVRESGAASQSFLRAGQWRVTSVLEDMSIPGMPAEAQAQMKQVMGKSSNASFEYCLTEEEAKRPQGKFFTGKDEHNCRYDRFTMGGGKIDAVMRCQADPSGQMAMTMTGTYSPESYENHVSMKIDGGQDGSMRMKMRSEAKRIGDCKPKES